LHSFSLAFPRPLAAEQRADIKAATELETVIGHQARTVRSQSVAAHPTIQSGIRLAHARLAQQQHHTPAIAQRFGQDSRHASRPRRIDIPELRFVFGPNLPDSRHHTRLNPAERSRRQQNAN
jgi:hypothetical protein